jgi:hypothetical protein
LTPSPLETFSTLLHTRFAPVDDGLYRIERRLDLVAALVALGSG